MLLPPDGLSRLSHASPSPSPRFPLAQEEEEVGWGAIGKELSKVSREERFEVGARIGVPVAAQVLKAQKQKPLKEYALGEELASALSSRESFWRGRAR